MTGVIFFTNQSAASLPNLEVLKTKHMIIDVVRLVNIFNCLAYDWRVKGNMILPIVYLVVNFEL
jgi:hypothetical protein